MWLLIKSMNRFFRALIVWLFVAVLAGCGFQLRGSLSLPPAMEKVLLQGVAVNSALAIEIRQALVSAGGELVDDRSQASAVLVISDDRFDKRVLSVDSQGRASEYELHYRLGYELRNTANDVLVERQQLDSIRDYIFDPANVLGKGAEESLLRREMRRLAVHRMLERLRSTCCGK